MWVMNFQQNKEEDKIARNYDYLNLHLMQNNLKSIELSIFLLHDQHNTIHYN